jgi:HEAT repeat protein
MPPKPAGGAELTKLLADLKSPDGATRQKAAEALAKTPPLQRRKEVAAAARAVLLSDDRSATGSSTRFAAAKLLAACDPKGASPTLLKLVGDGGGGNAMDLLIELKDPQIVDEIAALLSGFNLRTYGKLLQAIGPPAEKAVLPSLKHPDYSLRSYAFELLKDVGGEASLPILEEIARGQGADAFAARDALKAVRERVPLTADEWPRALEGLESPDPDVVRGAVRRIAVTPPVAARRADVLARLDRVADAPRVPWEAAAAAFQGIVRWGGRDGVALLARRLEGTYDGYKKGLAIDALAGLKDEAAAAVVAKMLRDSDGLRPATRALKAMGPVAEKAALSVLNTDEPYERKFARRAAAEVLAEIGGRDSLAPLERAWRDNDFVYSPEAELALAAVKGRLEDGETK